MSVEWQGTNEARRWFTHATGRPRSSPPPWYGSAGRRRRVAVSCRSCQVASEGKQPGDLFQGRPRRCGPKPSAATFATSPCSPDNTSAAGHVGEYGLALRHRAEKTPHKGAGGGMLVFLPCRDPLHRGRRHDRPSHDRRAPTRAQLCNSPPLPLASLGTLSRPAGPGKKAERVRRLPRSLRTRSSRYATKACMYLLFVLGAKSC